jgi:hypothetical protein
MLGPKKQHLKTHTRRIMEGSQQAIRVAATVLIRIKSSTSDYHEICRGRVLAGTETTEETRKTY